MEDKEPFYNYIIFLEKQIDLLERIFNNIEKIGIVGDCSNIRKIFTVCREEISNLTSEFNSVNNYYQKTLVI